CAGAGRRGGDRQGDRETGRGQAEEREIQMTGEELRDRGILAVDANTPEDWKATCDGVISWLARNGAEFTAEDVRPWIPEPPHPNAMGARFSAAVKTGVIQH
ncbi:MAG: hypothetical protein ACK55I_21745, partial [bacterium]